MIGFFSPLSADQLWGQPSLLSKWVFRRLLTWGLSSRNVELHLHSPQTPLRSGAQLSKR